jgi:hypothetical protein
MKVYKFIVGTNYSIIFIIIHKVATSGERRYTLLLPSLKKAEKNVILYTNLSTQEICALQSALRVPQIWESFSALLDEANHTCNIITSNETYGYQKSVRQLVGDQKKQSRCYLKILESRQCPALLRQRKKYTVSCNRYYCGVCPFINFIIVSDGQHLS